jgi:hypothetical protein
MAGQMVRQRIVQPKTEQLLLSAIMPPQITATMAATNQKAMACSYQFWIPRQNVIGEVQIAVAASIDPLLGGAINVGGPVGLPQAVWVRTCSEALAPRAPR